MSVWIRNSDGKLFDNEEDAYLDSIEQEDTDYLLDIITCEGFIPYDDLLHWAADHEGFWEHYQDQISEARGTIFDDDYRELDEDDLTALERLGVIPTA